MMCTTLVTAIFMAVTFFIQGTLAINATIAAQASIAFEAYKATTPYTTRPAPVAAKPNLAALKTAVLAGKYTSRLSNSTRSRCPQSCSSAGTDPSKWFIYHSINRLDLCNSVMLLDFAIFNPLADLNTRASISACTADLEPVEATTATITGKCQADSINQTEVTASLQLGSSGSSSTNSVADAVAALEQLLASSALSEASCNETIKFAYSGNVAIGLYVGKGLTNQGVITSVLEQLSTKLQSDGSVPETLVAQLCDDRSARYSIGIFASTNSDLSLAQLSVQTWKNSSCITNMQKTVPAWQNVTFSVPSLMQKPSVSSNSTTGNSTALQSRDGKLIPRADCTTVQVVAGDSCASLASECGITPAEFTIFNPSSTECSTLAAGEHVCCSAGTLPDFSPKPDSAGNCFSYLVVSGDSCSEIAATNSLTIAQLESFNTNVWGWNGCADLLAEYNICLSTGFPPMPTVVENSVCGPQVPGTPVAPPGTDLSTLNECPLNACCDIWGQCGTTTEFCTPSNSSTNAPGTAAPGQNGCISNCGTEILVSSPPAQAFSIGYYEAFDFSRPCLTMSVEEIDTTEYTHIHFAFATLNSDFSVNLDTLTSQLPAFQALTGVKRIMSFGGWSFSTDPSTYTIFRDSVSSVANMEVLIGNLVAFVNEWDLDGIDWDWEYPDEPDIPGIPAGTIGESAGYFLFLDLLKAAMPAGKTVSLTAPASFWYLQHFPIQAISQVVDYIVYMTYDLHGQWDYGNVFSDEGCSESACLRSHVNLTETVNALSMITKAGVPSNKVAVGVTSYARSFQMSTTGCWTEECTFTGPLSGAIPGPCTETPGYISDYELGLVINSDSSAMQLWDENSYSNILVYEDQTQWAAYMNDTNKAVRKLLYQDLTFLGTSDWAIDLQSNEGDGNGSGGDGTTGSGIVFIDQIIFVEPSPIINCIPPCTFVLPPSTLATPTIISFAPVSTLFVMGGSTVTSLSPLPITPSVISFFSVPIESGDDSSTFALTTSLKPNPLVISAGGVTSTINFAPVTAPYSGPEVVIISTLTFTVFGGSITFDNTPLAIPKETDFAQTVTIDGIVVSIPAITNILTDVEVLPTTVLVSNGVTQTFSEAQFTEFATISGQTVITTAVTASQTGGSSSSSSSGAAIILLTVRVQTGGFYWSPIPLPTLHPFPFPDFPEFPPLPDPHCFKLFGIFSIDCPPDKGPKTTTYKSGPPHPTCTANCGTLCTVNCEPKTGEDDEPSSTASPSSSSTSSCDPSISTGTGLCENGNFPYWDPGTQTVSCDNAPDIFDELGGDDALSACQQDADADPTDSDEAISEAQDCCAAGDTFNKRSSGNFGGDIFRRAACANLPAIPYYEQNPPAGSCHSTFVCDGNQWPNVCANARSAISSRSRTSILTYVGETDASGNLVDFHDTSLYPQGKMGWKGNVGVTFPAKRKRGENNAAPGWGLIMCEIEEYPFGSGNPFRDLSNDDVMRDSVDNHRAVNRLIPRKENGAHGRAMTKFYKAAGTLAASNLGAVVTDKRKVSAFAQGLVYCVDFINTPTTNDDAGYLLDSTAHNTCAQPYGVEFTLVNQAYTDTSAPAAGSSWNLWDPWFNVPNTGRLTQQVVRRVAGEPDQFLDLPPQYCYSPSPGAKLFNLATGTWGITDGSGTIYGVGTPRDDPGTDGANLKCSNVPGGNPTKRSIDVFNNETEVSIDGFSSEPEEPEWYTPITDIQLAAAVSPPKEEVFSLFSSKAVKDILKRWVDPLVSKVRRSIQELVASNLKRTKSPRSRKRQIGLGVDGGGSFTDPSALGSLFCANDDYDPCADAEGGCEGSDGFPPYANYASSSDSTPYNGPTDGLQGGGNPTSIPAPGAPGNTEPGGGGTVVQTGGGGGGGITSPTPSPSSKSPTTAKPTPPATTPFATCSHQDADPDSGITSAFCVCSGSTLAESINTAVTPANSCAYTALSGSPIPPPIQTIITTQTSDCSICTFVGLSETCNPLPGCTVTPTGVLAPSVFCTAIGTILDGVKVYIFTNYVTDTGSALEQAEDAACGAFGVSGFSNFGPTDGGDNTITNSDGTSWKANNMFHFTLEDVTHPQELICISNGIEKGGGPKTGDCSFEPALNAIIDDLVEEVFIEVIEIILDVI